MSSISKRIKSSVREGNEKENSSIRRFVIIVRVLGVLFVILFVLLCFFFICLTSLRISGGLWNSLTTPNLDMNEDVFIFMVKKP